MKTRKLSKKPSNPSAFGMSSQAAIASLGLGVTPRQFRRYIEHKLIPRAWVRKNANGHFSICPPSFKEWEKVKERISMWRTDRYSRGWKDRPRKMDNAINGQDKSSGIVTIEGVNMAFNLWVRSVEARKFSADQLEQIESLLRPMAEFHRLVVEDIARARKSPPRA